MQEHRDVDLILDRGAWAAGWRGDLLDLPGKFLLSDPEHTIPRPARAYQITDPQISDTAADHPDQPLVPDPDPVWQTPADTDDRTDDQTDDQAAAQNTTEGRHAAPEGNPTGEDWGALQDCLRDAPEEGITVAEIIEITGLSRATVYRRLRALAEEGQAAQLGDGYWRAI